jgi:pimeloyl-ACP methyl ester carboxylesterase
MPTASVNGTDIYYEIHGDGEPLLLIAGFACDHTIWSLVIPKLAANYRVIAFDNRGLGQSPGPGVRASIRLMAEDAAGLIDVLGLGPTHVAGHSMGGMIAQELALAHPEQIRGLLLLSTCARMDARGTMITESWGQLASLVDAATLSRIILPWIHTRAFFDTPGAVEQLINQFLSYPYAPSPQALRGQTLAISSFDALNRLSELNCPTLVLTGQEDLLYPIEVSEQLVRVIRGAQLAVVEGTGHGLLVESPDKVAHAMLSFLKQQRSQT